MSDRQSKTIIFSIALLIRLFLGYIFYGSADVGSFVGITQLIMNGAWLTHPVWCYFPIICFPLWFCGYLCAMTPLPSGFCIKWIPIIFDSLLAVLVFDLVKRLHIKHALRAGLLYALSPVGIIITCIHGQWDAVVLLLLLLSFYIREYFQETHLKYFLFGVFFALAFLLKPYTLVFIFFFFSQRFDFKQVLGSTRWRFLLGNIIAAGSLLAILFFFFKANKAITLTATTHYLVHSIWGIMLLVGLVLWIIGFVMVMKQDSRSYPFDFAQGARLRANGSRTDEEEWMTVPPVRGEQSRIHCPQGDGGTQANQIEFIKYLKLQCSALLGLITTVTICFALFAYYGFSIPGLFDIILRYGNQAAPIFGLPFAWPIQGTIIGSFLKNRLWTLLPIAGLAIAYYKNKIEIFHVALIVFALILGVSGLYCQYLMWLPPLLLILGYYRLAAIYNLIVGSLYLVYYINPLSNTLFPYEGMLSFAALHNFNWFMPPMFFTSEAFVPAIRILSNYAVPSICLCIAGYCFWEGQGQENKQYLTNLANRISLLNPYILIIIALNAIMFCFYLLVDIPQLGQIFNQSITTKIYWYHITKVGSYVTGIFDQASVVNVMYLLIALMVGWSVLVYKASRDSV